MRELSIHERAHINAQLESSNEGLQLAFTRLAFKYGYTLTEIAVHTGWAEGHITEALMSQFDLTEREGG